MKNFLLLVAIVTGLNANAVLGPIPITLNTEYRTTSPVIVSIASTIKLDSVDIEAIGANTFLELLASIPSVGFVNPQGNVPAVFIRGNQARHTLVLIDGVRVHDISSPDGASGYALESLPLAQIQRIEIIKGPYSSLYGSGAIGGVIQIVTKKGGNNNNINMVIGSNNSKKISFAKAYKSDKGFINFTVSKYQTDGISALANNSEKDNIDNQSLGLKIGYDIGESTDFSIGILKSTIDTEYDDNFGIFGTNPRQYQHNKNWHKTLEKLNLTFNHQFNNIISSKLSMTEINQNRDSFTNNISDGFNNKKYQTKDLTLLNEIKWGGSLVSVGFSRIDDKNITNNQSLSSKDIFIQWQKNIYGFDTNRGLRFISHSDFGKEIVYSLSVAKSLNHNIKLTGSYGTAFNAPTLYQSNTGDNPNLLPETSKNAEIGIEKQHYWGISGLKIYNNKVKNLIDYVNASCSNGGVLSYPAPTYSATCPIGETFVRAFYKNEDKLNIKGVELSVSANIKNYDISFNHNFVDSKLNNSNTQQARRPKNTTDLTISKVYNKFNSRLQIVKKSSSLDMTTTLAGYTLVNISTNYTYTTSTKISLNINNAFDKDYTLANGYNQLGRTIHLGLNYNF